MRAILGSGLVLAAALALAAPQGALQNPPQGIEFRDITQAAGIRFVHNTGAFGKKYLPETLGAGCAFIDYDNDGWPDILIVNGMDWPGHRRSASTLHLYHNNRDGTFTDVTRQAGLGGIKEFSTGAAWVDYDRDGQLDPIVSESC